MKTVQRDAEKQPELPELRERVFILIKTRAVQEGRGGVAVVRGGIVMVYNVWFPSDD